MDVYSKTPSVRGKFSREVRRRARLFRITRPPRPLWMLWSFVARASARQSRPSWPAPRSPAKDGRRLRLGFVPSPPGVIFHVTLSEKQQDFRYNFGFYFSSYIRRLRSYTDGSAGDCARRLGGVSAKPLPGVRVWSQQ